MPNGGLISILVLLPNLLFLMFPPRDVPCERRKPARGWEIMEWVGRLGVFMVPFFCWIEIEGAVEITAVAILIGALGLYYASWVRYVRRGRSFRLLFQPMWGTPLPMAVAPIVYLFAASVVLHSWWQLLATVLFMIGHLSISNLSWKDAKAMNS